MAFWGVEVKPGKPFTLRYSDVGGKLILTQATLGDGKSSKRSILQCEVGDSSPVYLCNLLPEKTESCSLNLEFEEDVDVIFSVVGPTSIHLSGFIHTDYPDSCDDDCDSDCDGVHGEDIAETESDGSDFEYDDSDEEDYDFIDDDDQTIHRNSGVVIEEILDDEKASTEDGGNKKPKKTSQLSDSKKDREIVVSGSTGASVLESEDEDGFPISPSHRSQSSSVNPKADSKAAEEKKKKKKKSKADSESKKNDGKDDIEAVKNLKRKIEPISDDQQAKRDEPEGKKKKKKKKGKKQDGEEAPNADQVPNTEEKKIAVADKDRKSSKAKAKVRTFPNGLVIEDLQMGRPDGKRATRGSKVSVRYIGKLQKNGKQFDSNIGRRPFEFRLGVGQVIKGWDVGVEGMRVGDKRRLTIPPSMGYGSNGAGEIPPNAWLLFDVELVDV